MIDVAFDTVLDHSSIEMNISEQNSRGTEISPMLYQIFDLLGCCNRKCV